MVSLSRLLAAAVDVLPESHAAAANLSPPTRNCLLPPTVSSEAVPARLLAAVREREQPAAFPSSATVSNAALNTSVSASSASRLGNTPLPLQRLLRDLGPDATLPQNMASLARTLAHFGRPSEPAVASALLFLASADPPESPDVDSYTIFSLFALFCADPDRATLDPAVQRAVGSVTTSPSEWRVDVLVQAVNSVAAQFNAPLDWRVVIHSLDVDGLEKQLTQKAFIDIAKAYISGSGGSLLPADCFVDHWMYPAAQLCIISHALGAADYIDWGSLDAFDGATIDDLASPYARVALVEKLVELDARDLLQFARAENSDLVLLSLTCFKARSNASLQQKLTVTLLTPVMSSYPRKEKILRQLWNVAPSLVEAGMIAMWKKDPSTMRIAKRIATDLHIQQKLITSGSSVEFALELALLAYEEDAIALESWLMDLIVSRGATAISALAVHLAKKTHLRSSNSAAHFSVDALRITFRCLLTCADRATEGAQASKIIERVRDVHRAYIRLNPRMEDLSRSADLGDPKVLLGVEGSADAYISNEDSPEISQAPAADTSESISEAAAAAAALLLLDPAGSGERQANFPNIVENETVVYFQNLYTRDLSTKEAVEVLRRFKESQDDYERRIFHCALHSLFDEYRFFKRYPDRELEITGRLFGAIIQESLLSGQLQGLAVRVVLDALKAVESPPLLDGRLAIFGLFALEQYISRIKDWPQYCAQILKLPRLRDSRPDLISEVTNALESYRGPMPSQAEKLLGLVFDDSPKFDSKGGVDRPARFAPSSRDVAADAASVRALLASPSPPAKLTPVKDPATSTSSLRPSPSMSMDGGLTISTLNLITLLGMTPEEADQVMAPDDSVQDKIRLIFNNLSSSMMDDKVNEMLDVLDARYLGFFSVYVVVKRASSEANFHHLYLTLLERMSEREPRLFTMIFDTSYRRVRVLLDSEKIASSTPERMVLKSLGSWIGSLTLARNRPILKKDLDLKELLIDAYSRGRLIAVVPFVSKVLEASQRSRVFKTTNPWLRGILSLMKEIYSVPDLKLNMKFELQLLCKSLGIDVNDIASSRLLDDIPAPDKQNNPDFTTKKPASSSPLRTSPSPASSPSPELRRAYGQAGGTGRAGIPMFSLGDAQAGSTTQPSVPVSAGPASSTGRVELGSNVMPNSLSMGPEGVTDLSNLLANASLTSSSISANQLPRAALHSASGISSSSLQSMGPAQRSSGGLPSESTLIPNLAQYIIISPTLGLFQNNPNLKRLLPVAIDRAIREIIQPVVERSCAIAFLTTKELTLKDFANEPDVGKVRRAALQMVQQLAGSLALVTSKEPLRVSMGNQLRSLLTPVVVGDQSVVEQTSQVICAANLEVGCAVIERHAKEKAARDLNEKIGPAFNARRPQHSSYNIGMAPGPELLRVYDQFSRLPRLGMVQTQNAGTQQPTVLVSQPAQISQSLSTAPHMSGVPVRSSNNTAAVSRETRANGTDEDSKRSEFRPTSSHVISRGTANIRPHGDSHAHRSFVGRRPGPTVVALGDARSLPATYGTPLPIMANSSEVGAAMLLAAGSVASSNGGASQFSTSSGSSALGGGSEEALSTQQVLERFNTIYPQLLALLSETIASAGSEHLSMAEIPAEHPIHGLWVQIPSAVKRSVTADEAGMAVAQKIFKRLYEGDSDLHREVHVLLLEGLRESCRRLSKELVSWLAYSEEHKKLHRDCIVALLKPGSLLNITNYDELLAKTIDNGRNLNALDFACFLVHRAVIDEPLATAAELYLTLEAIAKVGRRPGPPQLASAPEGLLALVDISRKVVHNPEASVASSTGSSDVHHSGPIKHLRDVEPNDPVGSREQIASCLADWQRTLASDSAHRPISEHTISSFLEQVRANLLNSDDARERFFRISVEIVLQVTTSALQSPASGTPGELAATPYTAVDSTVRLLGSLTRSEPKAPSDAASQGVHVLNRTLSALVKVMLKSELNADLRPHFRLLSGMITELAVGVNASDAAVIGGEFPAEAATLFSDSKWSLREFSSRTEALQFLDDPTTGFAAISRSSALVTSRDRPRNTLNVHVLCSIVTALSACSPQLLPNFAFSWLQLMSNKDVLPRLLAGSFVHGGNMFLHILTLMLKFLSTYLKEPQGSLTEGIRVLYKGTLRVLLVLLHDFPEFLCDYHLAICDVIPPNCVQLRNIVLASFPKSMRLPDPFLPELKVDQLPEMTIPPRILTDYMKILETSELRSVLDNYLVNPAYRGPSSMSQMESFLSSNSSENGEKVYSLPTISALVLYVGQHAISQMLPGAPPVMEGPATDLVQSLTRKMDPEGQYHLFNAIANQLRYPNSHTLYYSRLVLCLFHDSEEESVKEQITRVLLERLIAKRPHPWGLLVTFVELVKNSLYNFWGHEFVRCAPEIEELFEYVAKVCIVPTLQNQQHALAAAS